MAHFDKEKRRFERFKTDQEIFFTVTYEIKTKINFQLMEAQADKILQPKYPAISRDVSVEGLCLTSLKELQPGDRLLLEVYALDSREPTYMQGEVRWSKKLSARAKDKGTVDTGIKVLTVEGRHVEETFYRDENQQVVWSGVLEAVLGSFRKK